MAVFQLDKKSNQVLVAATHPLVVSASLRSIGCCCPIKAFPGGWLHKK